MKDSVFIIAEAGVNHNGDVNLAKEMVQIARDAGADAIKFQSFRAERLVTKEAPKAAYQNEPDRKTENQFEMLRRLELNAESHRQLFKYCRNHAIEFISTGFDEDSIEMLSDLGQARFKIPSGEITNLPYLRQIGHLRKPIIMSSGMATLREIESAIAVIEEAGTARDSITVLHCTSAYPTQMEDVNLHAMQSIQNAFGVKVGYSDHTLGIEVAVAATALGASVIEKHFTLDRNLPGPDHKASLEPDELNDLVCAIRNIESALGNGIKKPAESELENIEIVRRSIVASKTIAKGDRFTESNLTTKRPGCGLSPMRWDEVIGQYSSRIFQKDQLIEL